MCHFLFVLILAYGVATKILIPRIETIQWLREPLDRNYQTKTICAKELRIFELPLHLNSMVVIYTLNK